MARLIVNNRITLDGVMQAPGRPDEDRRGGFEHGGWAAPYVDEVMGRTMGEGVSKGGAILFGRRTYEEMRRAWEDGPEDNPFTKVLNERQKYVASTTLEEPLPWENSTLLEGDAADAVAKLKERTDGNLVVLGSGELVQSLMRAWPDRRVRALDPPARARARAARLFADGGPHAATRPRRHRHDHDRRDHRDLQLERGPHEAVPAQRLPARRADRRRPRSWSR